MLLSRAVPRSRFTIKWKFLEWFSCILLGYGLLDRGFAYIGVRPVYLGELALLLAVLTMLLIPKKPRLLKSTSIVLLLVFMVWGAVCTVPYIKFFGMDALRDAALWGYGTFAVAIAAFLVAFPERLRWLIERYRSYAVIFLVAKPVLRLIGIFGGSSLRFPGSPVPLIDSKAGNLYVQLSGINSFVLSGLARSRLIPLMLWFALPMLGTFNRAGLLSFLFSFLTVMSLKPLSRSGWRMVIIAITIVLVLFVTQAEISPPGSSRTLSIEKLALDLQSVFGTSEESRLENTKAWRIRWWTDIFRYTFGGPYFWTGKGYGINLADDDGYQVTIDHSLRSPHNGHMTILARSGVPGFILWILLQASWAVSLLRSYFVARATGRSTWAALFVFLIGFWTAAMVNTTFDVYLEGPMGGIWFWTLFGVGAAAVQIFRTRPDVLGKET